MPVRPEDLSIAGLPKTPFGGVKADAADALLKRAAWELLELLARNKQLAAKVDELELVRQALELQVASLEEAAAGHKEPDEIARTLLSSAQRAAREQREGARREGELLLKKARERAGEIEGDARKHAEEALAEIAALEQLRDDVARELRAALEGLVALVASSTSEGLPGEGDEPAARQTGLAHASQQPGR